MLMPRGKKGSTVAVRRPAAVSSPSNLEFQVQQLRLDKLVYALDALLVSFSVFLLLVSLPMFYAYVPTLPPALPMVLVGIAVAFTLSALIGNAIRLRKISRLETELKQK